MPSAGFNGLRVLAFESRYADEIAALIKRQGGQPIVAPAVREVPLEPNPEIRAFVTGLVDSRFDVVIFLTGVGVRVLAVLAATVVGRDRWTAALGRVSTVARGPKPAAALRELGVPVTLAIPEPNTWREILSALDSHAAALPLAGRRVAVQEYGESNPELLAGLEARGAIVTPVSVYQWALPDDPAPLEAAVRHLTAGEVRVVLFTSSIQLRHLFQVAARMRCQEPLRQALAGSVIASIGPTTSGELRKHGLAADLEPAHPKMGHLVKEAAARAAELLEKKRAPTAPTAER
jgi:uroporphyrinogen-III synthase